jgi:hypothetical protein
MPLENIRRFYYFCRSINLTNYLNIELLNTYILHIFLDSHMGIFIVRFRVCNPPDKRYLWEHFLW